MTINNTSWTGNEDLDLDYLDKLARAINNLLNVEQSEEDEDSIKLRDARINVKHRIKGSCIDLGIHREIIDSYIKNQTK